MLGNLEQNSVGNFSFNTQLEREKSKSAVCYTLIN